MKQLFWLLISLSLIGGFACTKKSNFITAEPNLKGDTVVDDDDNIQYFDPNIDILFVIDNSGSMEAHQRNFIKNIELFIGEFTKQTLINYHVGVLSTDMVNKRPSCCGELNGDTRYVTNQTPDSLRILKENLLLGIRGDGYERVIAPVVAALTPPLVSGYNAGFYRENAHLAVVTVTDAEDQSHQSPRDFYNFLLNLKKGKKEKISAAAVMIPSDSTISCPRDDSSFPRRIEDFMELITGTRGAEIMNLCSPDYGQRLAKLGSNIASRVGRHVFLNRVPDPDTILVTYGTQVLPRDFLTGWSLDVVRNVIYLGPNIKWDTDQPSDTKVKVKFETLKFPGE